MMSGRALAYFGWTLVLGIAWYILFVMLGLVTGGDIFFGANAFGAFAAFPVVSAIVGFAFRNWIASASDVRAVLLGCVLPILGGALYMLAWHASWRVVHGPDPSTRTNAAWLEFPLIGAYFALYFFYATMPLGVVAVLTLRQVERNGARDDDAARKPSH
jgi:hypothetical protein